MQRTTRRITRSAAAAAALVGLALAAVPHPARAQAADEKAPPAAEAPKPTPPAAEPAPPAETKAAPAPAAEPGAKAAAAPAAAPRRTFGSAEEAADALIEALRSEEDGALTAIFGPEVSRFEPTDQVAARVERLALADAAMKQLVLREDGPDEMTLVIGDQAWPFPIPVIEEDGAWRFDTESGYEELLNRIVGAHELAAIELLRSYVGAQVEYASRDRDGDEVLEYAQRILSSTGTQDGLYWPSDAEGAEESPFGPFVADAGAYAKGELGDPYRGYYFRVLKRQGTGVPGGAYDYVINGNMIGGYALLAWPADYGSSGVMTFEVNQQGKVFQKDLGPTTATLVGAIDRYAPDSTWAEVAD
jgi:hypothetical protein